MASSIEQALVGLAGLLTNAGRPLPSPGSLNGFVPTLDDLKREAGTGIVMQYQEGNTEKPLDGGDSAHRTGVLAFCGSQLDANNLDKFYLTDSRMMVRHPTQEPWNNPNNCTRDQLIGYLAGCWRSGRIEIAQGLLAAHEARGWFCQDIENDAPGTVKNPPIGDPLGPQHMMYMRICAGQTDAATDLVSQLALYTAIQTASDDPESEQNQLLLLSIIGCQLDFYLAKQDHYADALHKYWSGVPWRGQRSIATSLIQVCEIERGRYSTPNVLDYLLPQNILQELRHINLRDAVEAFKNGNPLYFAELAGKIAIAALRDIAHYAKVIFYSLQTLGNIATEVASGILKALHIQASKELAKIASFLVPGIGTAALISSVLSTAGALLGLGSTRSDAEEEAEKQFRQQTLSALAQLSNQSKEILDKLVEFQASMEAHFAEFAVRVDNKFKELVSNELAGEVGAVEILLLSLENNPPAQEAQILRANIRTAITDLNARIITLAQYGSAGLPACFHAYGIVMRSLALLGKEASTQAETTREEFGKLFRGLLSGDNGLNKTIIGLSNTISDSYAAFDKAREKMLIGAVSVRNGSQRNMDDTKDILAEAGYRVSRVWCTVSGSIESLNFSLAFSTESAFDSALPYGASDVQGGTNVFSGAMFLTAPWYGGLDRSKYHSPDIGDLQAAAVRDGVTSIVRDGGAAVQKSLGEASTKLANAKQAKPGLETLAAAVRAAFDERPIVALTL